MGFLLPLDFVAGSVNTPTTLYLNQRKRQPPERNGSRKYMPATFATRLSKYIASLEQQRRFVLSIYKAATEIIQPLQTSPG
jgi:hypothetical protein